MLNSSKRPSLPCTVLYTNADSPVDLTNLKRLQFKDNSMNNFVTVSVEGICLEFFQFIDVDNDDSLEVYGGKAFNRMNTYNHAGSIIDSTILI